jgi:hypothetical protein
MQLDSCRIRAFNLQLTLYMHTPARETTKLKHMLLHSNKSTNLWRACTGRRKKDRPSNNNNNRISGHWMQLKGSLAKNGPGEEESSRRNYAVEAEELRSEDKHTQTQRRALIHHERISPAARDEETLSLSSSPIDRWVLMSGVSVCLSVKHTRVKQ